MANTFDWRDEASDSVKGRLLYDRFGHIWGDHAETDLIYEVGDVDGLTTPEIQDIEREFLRGCQSAFRTLEFLRGEGIPGEPMLMHLAGMLILHPSFILRQRRCALLQVGYNDSNISQPDPAVLNFHHEWKSKYM